MCSGAPFTHFLPAPACSLGFCCSSIGEPGGGLDLVKGRNGRQGKRETVGGASYNSDWQGVGAMAMHREAVSKAEKIKRGTAAYPQKEGLGCAFVLGSGSFVAWDGPARAGTSQRRQTSLVNALRIMPVVCKGMGDAAHACGRVASRLPVVA